MAGNIIKVIMFKRITYILFCLYLQLAMQNLKAVLKETQDDATVSSTSADTDDDSVKLLPGVNFIHGDIFDVVSTVCQFDMFHFHMFISNLFSCTSSRIHSRIFTCMISDFPLLCRKELLNTLTQGINWSLMLCN